MKMKILAAAIVACLSPAAMAQTVPGWCNGVYCERLDPVYESQHRRLQQQQQQRQLENIERQLQRDSMERFHEARRAKQARLCAQYGSLYCHYQP